MKTTLTTALIGLGLLIATSSAWAQSQTCMAVSATVGCKPEANAALMISGGESPKCQLGNISDVYVVTVSTFVNLEQRTYIRSAQGCVVLPITAAIGTRIKITGVLQDTGAQPGAPGLPDSPVNVSESCFNVEGFSVGLAANSQSEFDPQLAANIINAQGFGFLWYDSDNDLKPGPYSYTVVGCSGHACPTTTTYFNTDGSPGTQPACAVLDPLS
jgi:hypothetical protein